MESIGRHRVTCGNISDSQVDSMLTGEKVHILYVTGYVCIETGVRWEKYVCDRLEKSDVRRLRVFRVKYASGGRFLENLLICGCLADKILPEEAFHPSPYRGVELPTYVISRLADPGKLVLDPCCGMGYTARATVAAGMAFRGNELNRARLAKTMRFLQKNP